MYILSFDISKDKRLARSTGNPGIFYQKIIEIFITVNGQGQLSEGPGRGNRGFPL